MLPSARFEIPVTARRTIDNFDADNLDAADAGRSTLFGRDVFSRAVSAGEAALLTVAPRLKLTLPRLARRFNVDTVDVRAKSKQT